MTPATDGTATGGGVTSGCAEQTLAESMGDFLTSVLPHCGVYFIARPYPNGKGFEHFACKTIAEAVKKALALDARKENAYFACASFKQASYLGADGKTHWREQDNAGWARSFWLDIDVGEDKAAKGTGYATVEDAIRAIGAFLKATRLPRPTVVSSGGGLHCYWPLTSTIEKAQWVQVAKPLKRLMATIDPALRADPARTADIASILRPPGTHNRKPERGGAAVQMLRAAPSIAYEEFKQRVDAALLRVEGNAASINGSALTTLRSNLLPDPMQPGEFSAEKIIAGCQQFAWAQANQADLEEPLWRAMIGTLYHTDAPDIIHQFSNQDPDYTAEETESKAKAWQGGGVKCETLEDLRPAGCKGCPHKGKIKSPSALGFRGHTPVIAAAKTGLLVNIAPLLLDKIIDATEFPFWERRAKRAVPLLHHDNVLHLLNAYGITLSYNVITKEIEEHHATTNMQGDHAKDVFLSLVKSLCAQNGMPSDGVELHLTAIAQKNEHNPVVRYLARLQWDGTSRLDALVGALNIAANRASATRIILHRMLLQACAAADAGIRGMAANPAAKPKYEYVPILVGKQGAKKSSFIHDFVPRDLRQYVRESTTVNADRPDSVKQAISYWICELGEIDVTFSRSGISELKAFLSRYHDVLRLPYARTASKFVRRTMFMGSVNDYDCLRDSTGNRRYMPIVARSTLNWNDGEIDQLWAEAWQQYLQGEQWWPTVAEQAILETVAEAHTEQTPIEEKLRLLFDWQGSLTVADGARRSATELWELCFPNRHPLMTDMKATVAAARRLWRANGATLINEEEHVPRANGKPILLYRRSGKACGCAMPKRR